MADHPYRVIARLKDPYTGKQVVRTLYEPQEKQVLLHGNKKPNLCYGGAAGGGKSKGARWHGFQFCIRVPGARVLLLRRRFKDLQTTHLLELPTEIPEGMAELNKAEHILRFPKDSVMVFGHCNTEADFASWLSSEWDMIILDEAGQFTPWMLSMLPSRLRTTKPDIVPQYVLCTNPGGVGHLWIKSRFIDREVWVDDDPTYDPSEYDFIPSFVHDNKYVNKQYVARLKALPEKERRAYLFGDWDIFVGQVFTEWNKDVHVVRQEVPKEWMWYGGLDWGMRNPGAFYLVAVGPGGDVYCRHEMYFKNLTAYEAGQKAGMMMLGRAVEYIACDSSMSAQVGHAAPTLLEEFQNGIQHVYATMESDSSLLAPNLVGVAKGPGSRFVRQQLLHRYLAWEAGGDGLKIGKRPKITFHPDCKHAIRTIPALPHDETKPEEVDTEAEDHPYDAITYFLMSRPAPSEGPHAFVDYDHTHPGLTPQGDRRMSTYEKTMRQLEEQWNHEERPWRRDPQTEEFKEWV